MKLAQLKIVNFRCFKSVTLECGSLHAFVGCNSAGKSTVLHALDFLFNPAAGEITEDWFHQGDTKQPLRVEGIFADLTDSEKAAFKGYTRPDGTLQIARIANWLGDEPTAAAEVEQSFNRPQPKLDWLNSNKIDSESIKNWAKQELLFKGHSFTKFLGGERRVTQWREKAAEFAALQLQPDDYEDTWAENPRGFGGVLKGSLPDFELVPAVRDAADEQKVAKTNPFGRIVRSVLENLDPGLKTQMAEALAGVSKRLNREAGQERVNTVAEIEERLKQYVREVMPVDLELQFQAPSVEMVLTSPTILINDGYKGPVEYKGHGLQRTLIMSILRAYSELIRKRLGGERRALILGVEEPELYMHPPMLRSVRKLLRKLADGGDQVFFTTHNPILVDVGYFDEIVRVDSAAGGVPATLHQLSMSAMIEDIEARHPNLKNVTAQSMRERYNHVYTTTRNEGFFAKRVILVEGPTELYALPIYATAMGIDFDTLGVVVVECGTKDQIDRLYRCSMS